MKQTPPNNKSPKKEADWELDFYSRPILEPNGKKRWELLISSSEDISGKDPFRWEKRCPANEVNSIWLTKALSEALTDAQEQGWEQPLKLRCWRTSMKTMVKKAASQLGLEVIASRRTYSLISWLAEREKDLYPKQEGYMAGPLAPPLSPILNQPLPLPEAARGDAWSFASLPIGTLRDAKDWPIEFRGLLPIGKTSDETIPIPGLRLFSKKRSLALAGWIGGLEPVRLVIQGKQLLLEAGQEDRWLVTDLDESTSVTAQKDFMDTRENSQGLQFIAVQSTPSEKTFAGFWMLRDLPQL